MRRKNVFRETNALILAALLASTALFVFTPMTGLTNAEQIGQTKVQEGFESWPPIGWCLSGPAVIVQTTGDPGDECMIGHHAAKMYFSENNRFFNQIWTLLMNGKKGDNNIRVRMYTIGHRFFGEMGTPTFNGKKGGGNILTFWHKQLIFSNPDQLAVFVTNGVRDSVQIADYTSSMNWTYEKISLNDFIHPTKTMQVWFITILHGESNVYLDEVTITGVSGE